MKVKIGIYKITSPSGKIYVGQSIDIEKRFKHYLKDNSKYFNQKKLINSFNKYNVKNHIFEIIEICKIQDLNNRERYWQEFYNCISNTGLNCKLTTTKDKSGKLSIETKLKMSNSQKGKKPRLGMKNSEEMNKKISESNIGKKMSEISKLKMSKSNKNKRKVIDVKNNIIYDSVKKVSVLFNINYGTLNAYLKNKIPNKTNFKYLNNE